MKKVLSPRTLKNMRCLSGCCKNTNNQQVDIKKKSDIALMRHQCIGLLFTDFESFFKELLDLFPIKEIPLWITADLPEFVMKRLLERLKTLDRAASKKKGGLK